MVSSFMLNRRRFLKLSATALAAASAGCLSGKLPAEKKLPESKLPSENAWRFGIIADTQWEADDNGFNPASCAVEIMNTVYAEFIKHNVEFAFHMGDMTDDGKDPFAVYNRATEKYDVYGPADAMGIVARYTQQLYNRGIGFFPLRGNHENSEICALEFRNFFPQTQNGIHNSTEAQRAAYAVFNPDAKRLPDIKRTGKPFSMGTNFSSPSDDLKGFSYSFDHKNVRFVIPDIFTLPDGTKRTIRSQQDWITDRLKTRETEHAIVLTHKGLLTQRNRDCIFGAETSKTTPGQDEFITSLSQNGVRYLICGHDHMYDRSHVYTHDGESAKVTQIIAGSDSSKFYIPRVPSNDETYSEGRRQKLISQELFAISYIIVTVDGEHVTFDYYSSPCYTGDTIVNTPYLNFSRQDTFGYSLNGRNFLVPYGAEYSVTELTSAGGTTAKILGGINGNEGKDLSGRRFNVEVCAGFYPKDGATAGDILTLKGMDYTLGSGFTDIFTLSMTYDSGSPVLAGLNEKGQWQNAVDFSSGGVGQFIRGAWKPEYPLGTYGIDTSSKTVWAVINTNGFFAPVNF